MMRDGSAPDRALLDRMIGAIAHRGPDGDGLHIARSVGLAQVRLAIIDLETGDQPIHEPGGAVIVANGEIYNYIELKQTLTDISFSSESDCEPPLHLYRKNGVRFADALRGMYALAIHDMAQDCLILSRDPFGIKPLYYCETNEFLAFASEPQALLAAGVAPRAEDPRRRDELLQLQFNCGRETIFRNIQRVLPGETLVIRAGRVVERHRIEMLPTERPDPLPNLSVSDALLQLDRTLETSVRLHQRSDVPYGMFLSGGIDSSAILALMARLNANPVHAFTIGFSKTAVHDERDHAKAVAKAVGAEHHEIEFDEADFWTHLPEVASCMDDPTADYAVLPTWKLAREAAHELKVILCGEGGDELFAGYGRYRSQLRPWWQGGRTMRARGIFDGLGVLRNEPQGWRDGIDSAQTTATLPHRSRLQIAQATDCADWLPNDLLTKLDRCLMAHGLEGRTPFLDREVAKIAFNLPDDMKIKKGLGKWLLRQWLEQVLPAARPFERKRGFTVPVGEWIQRRGDTLGPLVAAQPAIAELCHPERVKRIFCSTKKRAGNAAWILLFYALWHRCHIENEPNDGDVFAVLSQGTSR
jgi:asparagine synthase (glutamine-hydrolysing)